MSWSGALSEARRAEVRSHETFAPAGASIDESAGA
jgi:hypothetical protein